MTTDEDFDLWSKAWRIAEDLADLDTELVKQRLRDIHDPALREAAQQLVGSGPAGVETEPSPTTQWPGGRSVGGFVLRRELGHGGSGTVWEAEDTSHHRIVALKLLREALPESEARQRFRYEAALQAQLSHPNVVQFYGAGIWVTVEGRQVPWIAMELVRGARPVTRFVREESLSIPDICRLFAEICRGVGHAHEQGVRHRDIKPSNVLVGGDGRPVVIDFGIARSDSPCRSEPDPKTRTGSVLGTFEYMAPEQLSPRSAVGVRADIYGLGLVLYEALAGQPRFSSSHLLAGASSGLTERMKPAPSLVAHGVPRELDWVVAKASAFDPERRYGSAEEMAEDLFRYLRTEPLLAGPRSSFYSVRLFLRRHKLGVLASAAVLVAVLAGVSTATWGYITRVDSLSLAEVTAAELTTSYRFIEDLLQHMEPGDKLAPGETRTLLRHAYDQLAEGQDPPWRSQLLIGQLFRNLAAPQDAVELLQSALRGMEAYRGLAPAEAEKRHCKKQLAYALWDLARYSEGEAIALELLGSANPEDEREIHQLMGDLGLTYIAQGNVRRAAEMLEPSALWMENNCERDDLALMTSRYSLGLLRNLQARPAEAVLILTDVFARRRAAFGLGHPQTLKAATGLAQAQFLGGEPSVAFKFLQLALKQAEVDLPADHPAIVSARNQLAVLLGATGDRRRAIAVGEALLETKSRAFGEFHPSTLVTHHDLGVEHLFAGDYEEGLHILKAVSLKSAQQEGVTDREILVTKIMQAQALLQLERYEECSVLASEVFDRMSASPDLGPTHPNTLIALGTLGEALHSLGRLEESAERQELAVQLMKESCGPLHPGTLALEANLATLRTSMGQPLDAIQMMESLLTRYEERGEGATEPANTVRGNMAYAYLQLRDYHSAWALLDEAERLWPVGEPKEGRAYLPIALNRARTQAGLGLFKAAKEDAEFVIRIAGAESSLGIKARAVLDSLPASSEVQATEPRSELDTAHATPRPSSSDKPR